VRVSGGNAHETTSSFQQTSRRPADRQDASTTVRFCDLDATGLPRGGSRFWLHEAAPQRPFLPRVARGGFAAASDAGEARAGASVARNVRNPRTSRGHSPVAAVVRDAPEQMGKSFRERCYGNRRVTSQAATIRAQRRRRHGQSAPTTSDGASHCWESWAAPCAWCVRAIHSSATFVDEPYRVAESLGWRVFESAVHPCSIQGGQVMSSNIRLRKAQAQ
jgi:hypothetical protein